MKKKEKELWEKMIGWKRKIKNYKRKWCDEKERKRIIRKSWLD